MTQGKQLADILGHILAKIQEDTIHDDVQSARMWLLRYVAVLLYFQQQNNHCCLNI